MQGIVQLIQHFVLLLFRLFRLMVLFHHCLIVGFDVKCISEYMYHGVKSKMKMRMSSSNPFVLLVF